MEKIFEFEGQKIAPSKRGIYNCPFGCGDPRYPKPKWKTIKGIKNHLNKCTHTPSKVKAQQEEIKKTIIAQEKRLKIEEAEGVIKIANCKHKVGDGIYYWAYWVRKPTHKNGRRIRYEEVRSYNGEGDTIRSLTYKHGAILINEKIPFQNAVWCGCS